MIFKLFNGFNPCSILWVLMSSRTSISIVFAAGAFAKTVELIDLAFLQLNMRRIEKPIRPCITRG